MSKPDLFDDDDVIEAEKLGSGFIKVSRLQNIVHDQVNGYHGFVDGIECRVLKPGRQWQEGTLKVTYTIEFHPNQPDTTSELDDIRNLSI